MRRVLLGTAITVMTVSLSGCFPFLVAGVGGSAAAAGSASSPLSLGTQVDDTTIKTHAIAMLNDMPALNNNNDTNVEVVTFNRIVLLLGQVPNEKIKRQIAKEISTIKRVRVVYNQLTIGKRVSYTQYAKDSWITTEIKAKMVGKVNPSAFKVVTENGVVYLLAVTTQSEGAEVAQIASRVKGVRQVVEAFSYLKDQPPAQVKDKIN